MWLHCGRVPHYPQKGSSLFWEKVHSLFWVSQTPLIELVSAKHLYRWFTEEPKQHPCTRWICVGTRLGLKEELYIGMLHPWNTASLSLWEGYICYGPFRQERMQLFFETFFICHLAHLHCYHTSETGWMGSKLNLFTFSYSVQDPLIDVG